MAVVLTEYAVRVKGTNKYLPRPQRRDGRGGSHLEPIDFSNPSTWPQGYAKGMQIRTYRDARAAKVFLNSWLQGKFITHRSGSDWDYEEETECIPQPQRRAEDMEVVAITIYLP